MLLSTAILESATEHNNITTFQRAVHYFSWVLFQARRLGKNESELLQAFPTLRAEDLANAWAYSRSHLEEIERQIRENEEF